MQLILNTNKLKQMMLTGSNIKTYKMLAIIKSTNYPEWSSKHKWVMEKYLKVITNCWNHINLTK